MRETFSYFELDEKSKDVNRLLLQNLVYGARVLILFKKFHKRMWDKS